MPSHLVLSLHLSWDEVNRFHYKMEWIDYSAQRRSYLGVRLCTSI